jgi:hypothetical protein
MQWLSLSPRKKCNYMSFCLKDIDYQREYIFLDPSVYPAGPQTLIMLIVKCLFLRSHTAWKLPSNFISLETTAFVPLAKQTANISRHCMGYEFLLWPWLRLKWNRSAFMNGSLCVIGMWAQLPSREHVVIPERQDFITQKCFVKDL